MRLLIEDEGNVGALLVVFSVAMSEGRVQEGDWVVLSSSDGKRVLGHITAEGSARVGKRKRRVGTVVGARWGDVFAVRGDDSLERVVERGGTVAGEEGLVTARDNRDLHDDAGNQRLEQGDILKMKEGGVRGEDIVRAVAGSSSTFKGKTEFSQEKYLKRKRDKFDLRVRVLRPTASSLCETYFQRSPEKTLHMRPDALALLLGYSGIRSGARVMVYENCTGLVTGAVAERLGGVGRIINVFVGNTPPGVEVIRMLNLSPAAMRSIVHTPVEVMGQLAARQEEDDEPLRYVSREDAEASRTETTYAPSARRAEAIALRSKRGIVKSWINNGCDCLIIATRFDVIRVFDTLLQHVAPSGSFAAYCTNLQAAAELQYALQMSKMAVRVELTESTLIQHQVLPGRSHPAMSDSATGGYIVSGIRIVIPEELRRSVNARERAPPASKT